MMRLQLIYDDGGAVVHFPAGGPIETDLRNLIRTAILAEGVGFFRTEAQVAAAIDRGLDKALYDFKAQSILAI